MKGKFFKTILISSIMMLTTTIQASFAMADPVTPHFYANEHNSMTNYGGSYYNVYDSKSLYTFSDLGNYGAFITNEMWTSMGDDNEWIEIGDADGYTDGVNWNGHFTAVQPQQNDKYHEYRLGPRNPSGGHSFQTKYLGSYWWGVYVDNAYQMKFYMPYDYSNYTNVGVETNNSSSNFTNGMFSYAQYLDSAGTWHNWYSATNWDHNIIGWRSTYTPSNNRNTYYHN